MNIAISKKKQRDFVRARWENILAHFGRFSRRSGAEHLHRIRVELKKLRALVYLREKSGYKVNPKEKSLLKKLFRRAGVIREAQVAAQLMKSLQIDARKIPYPDRENVKHLSKDFVRIVKANADEITKLNAEFGRNVSPISTKKVTTVLNRLESEFRKALFPKLVAGKLHEARKAMKRYIYIQSLLKNEIRRKYDVHVKKLRLIEEAIGKWHDTAGAAEAIQQSAGTSAKLQQMRKMEKQQLNLIRKLVKSAL